MMPFSLFLALKYLKPKRSFVSVVTLISVVGILLGVAILVIVLSVMTGFDDMWREKILGFSAHLTVVRPGAILEDDEALCARLRRIPGVTQAASHVQTLVLLRKGERLAAPHLIGLTPEKAGAISEIPRHIQPGGAFDLSAGHLVIGCDLAAQLGVRVGDAVLVYSPKTVMNRDEIQLPEDMVIAGIFELGMWEFDSGFALASLGTARQLCGMESGAMAIRVMTDDPLRAQPLADRIVETLGPEYRAVTWMDMNRTLFDALRVEKSMMFLLLVFITIVAMFSVTNTLIVIGVQKTGEIGLLKAIGASPLEIMGVFIWHGWIQSVVGTVSGIGAALLTLQYRNELVRWLSVKLHVDLFPKSIYLLSEIPSRTLPSDVLTIAAVVFGFCTLASIVPAARAAALNPVEALRQE